MASLNRILKLAQKLYDEGDEQGLAKVNAYLTAFLKKHGHYAPNNNGTTPNPWRRNMDYAPWENSPYYGSVAEFMEKFPGGISDWRKWREKNKKDHNTKWNDMPWTRQSRKAYLNMITKSAANVMYMVPYKDGDPLPTEADGTPIEAPKYKKFQPVKLDSRLMPEEESVLPGYGRINSPLVVDTVLWTPYKKEWVYNLMYPYVSGPTGKGKLKMPLVEEYMLLPDTGETKEESKQQDQPITPGEERSTGIVSGDIGQTMHADDKHNSKKSEAHYEPVGGDDVDEFNDEPRLFSNEGLGKYKSVKEFLKKYRKHHGTEQDAADAAYDAAKDFVAYWQLLLKGKKKRKGKK